MIAGKNTIGLFSTLVLSGLLFACVSTTPVSVDLEISEALPESVALKYLRANTGHRPGYISQRYCYFSKNYTVKSYYKSRSFTDLELKKITFGPEPVKGRYFEAELHNHPLHQGEIWAINIYFSSGEKCPIPIRGRSDRASKVATALASLGAIQKKQ
jgi:hypothetical protein